MARHPVALQIPRRRLLGAMAALPVALGLDGAQAQGRANELRIGMAADISSMDPHWLNTSSNNVPATHVFERLVDWDHQGRFVPSLAQSWRMTAPDQWEFKLRTGVKWHDGSDFTADDVIFSLDRPKQLVGTPSGFASFVRNIVGMQAPDKHTLRIRVSTPNNAWFPLDLSNLVIVQKRACEKAAAQADFDNGRAMIGTGPYRFVRFVRGDRAEYVRNEQYWGGPLNVKPQFEKVTLRILIQDATRMAALLAGDLDVIENIPPQDLAKLAANTQFRIVKQVSWRTMLFHMDQAREVSPFITDKTGRPLARNPFKDQRVRHAFNLAINRQAIAERVMEGLAVPSNNLMCPTCFGYNPALKPVGYDPEAAKKLLAEAGYPNGFSLVLHGPNNRYLNDEQVVQTVAGMLARIGIQTRVETMPQASYFPRFNKGEFSFAFVGWGSLPGDSSMRHQFGTYDEQAGWGAWNGGRGSYPELDAMLKQARATPDDAKRAEIARNAAALIARNDQAVFLYHQVYTWAMRREFNYPGRVDEQTLGQFFTRA